MSGVRRWKRAGLATLALGLLLAAGCGVTVQKDEQGGEKRVDIRTPVGDLKVRKQVDVRDIGLSVYPGARPVEDRHDDESSANVNISTPWFGLKVVAAKFESDDDPDKVLEFYRKEMKSFGDVSECRGNIDFQGERGHKKLVCKSGRGEGTSLVVGTEERHRIFNVKPRRGGSEFALVYIATREGGETI